MNLTSLTEINELLKNPLYNILFYAALTLIWIILSIFEMMSNIGGWYLVFNGFFIGVNVHIMAKEFYLWKLSEK